jgi:hypothetical protein
MRLNNTPQQLLAQVDCLCNAWCDRRCLQALRCLLPAWPLSSPLTDGWGELGIALKNVRAFARRELSGEELAEVEQLIRDLDRIVQRT